MANSSQLSSFQGHSNHLQAREKIQLNQVDKIEIAINADLFVAVALFRSAANIRRDLTGLSRRNKIIEPLLLKEKNHGKLLC